ncbi:MAG: type 4a pilus biogenesis protein PilO [Phycisphaeraceae bacterium]|nr:type 4a pilus biogenesis protein PilO [Phycisphaeraceae bacterium]
MKLGIREMIFLLVLAAIPVAAWFFVFEPRNQDIEQSRREIAQMETTLVRLDQLTDEVGDVRTAIDEAELRLADFRQNIPDANEVDDMLAEIHRIGERNALGISSIRALNRTETQGYAEIPLSLEIDGSFRGLYRFLIDLERLPRITRVRDLKLERNLVESRGRGDDDDTPAGQIDASMTVVIYCEGELEGDS